MNRITRWIQEKKAYSNPTFGAMVMLSAMVFPVFQASARLVEPVQPMALNGEDVVDALGGVEAGLTVDQAFGVQPVPFREFIKFNRTIYNTLFDDGFDVSKAGYYLDDEINEGDVFFDFNGSTVIDNEFVIRFAILTNVNLTGGSLLPGDIASLAEHNSNILSFTGTISTAKSTVNIAGLVWQGTRLDTNERVRFLYILDTISHTFIGDLEMVFFQPRSIAEEADPVEDCLQALADAANANLAALEDAIYDYNTCTANMSNQLVADLARCTGAGIGGTFLRRFIPPIVTAITMGGCGIWATTKASLASNVCINAYENSRDAAQRAYDRAVQAARDTFGDNCLDAGNPA